MQLAAFGGDLITVDDEDWEKVIPFSWSIVGGNGDNRYAFDHTAGVMMHHLILPHKVGYVVDHKNRDGLDNRRGNLRYATASQNKANGRRYLCGSSGQYKGVYKRRDRFRASIRIQGKLLSLGTFDSPEQAALCYNAAALKYFGEFASINVL